MAKQTPTQRKRKRKYNVFLLFFYKKKDRQQNRNKEKKEEQEEDDQSTTILNSNTFESLENGRGNEKQRKSHCLRLKNLNSRQLNFNKICNDNYYNANKRGDFNWQKS